MRNRTTRSPQEAVEYSVREFGALPGNIDIFA